MFKKQMMIMTILMTTAFFLIAGCGPKADPAMVEKVNSFFGAQSTDTYKGAQKYSPVQPAVGQFVIHGNTDKNGKRSVTRTAIVGQEAGGWILETYTVDEFSESCTQMLLQGLENIYKPGGIDNLDIIWVKIKDENGQIQTIEGPAMAMARGFYKKALQSFDINAISGQATGSDITVPAGKFISTFRTDSEVKLMGMTFSSKSWVHGKVPVNGMVKSITDGGKITSVLLDFGNSGAKACF